MTRLHKHRHPADGGYQRGEKTRARIIVGATELFGEQGFEGASTRDIAARAGVSAPALQYYFDSKEGLYLACVEHIAAHVSRYMAEVVERAESALARNARDAALIEAFCAIQMRSSELMFGTDDNNGWRRLVARQQTDLNPSFASQSYYEGVTRRLWEIMAAIVGRLLGRPAADPETQIRAVALSGQMLVLDVARRTTANTLKWNTVDADRLARLKRVIGEQTAVALHSMAAARGGGGDTSARVKQEFSGRRNPRKRSLECGAE